jgi:hypothetical protein
VCVCVVSLGGEANRLHGVVCWGGCVERWCEMKIYYKRCCFRLLNLVLLIGKVMLSIANLMLSIANLILSIANLMLSIAMPSAQEVPSFFFLLLDINST